MFYTNAHGKNPTNKKCMVQLTTKNPPKETKSSSKVFYFGLVQLNSIKRRGRWGKSRPHSSLFQMRGWKGRVWFCFHSKSEKRCRKNGLAVIWHKTEGWLLTRKQANWKHQEVPKTSEENQTDFVSLLCRNPPKKERQSISASEHAAPRSPGINLAVTRAPHLITWL